MGLSRGWYGLILFWSGLVTFCGIGAGTLQMLGSPVKQQDIAVERDATPAPVEFADLVPLTPIASLIAADLVLGAPGLPEEEFVPPNAAEAPPEPVTVAAAEATAALDRTSFSAELPKPVATEHLVGIKVNEKVRPEDPPRGRKMHLRIVRDSEKCPKVACYKWRLIEQRMKPRRPATVDLAGLQLAPSIREAAENGDVELIIDAVEHHKTVKGRDSIIFVAISLAGVMPHD